MIPLRHRATHATELLDAATLDSEALVRNLRDIRRINALLGWTTFTGSTVLRTARTAGLRTFSLIDIASGSADIPLAIARRAERTGMAVRILATDISPQIVTIAREQSKGVAAITVESHDALALPFAPGSFDIALCTLALHHFTPEMAVAVLRSMASVGRCVLVFDVVRDPLAYAGVVALTHLLGMNYMTRHDGPVSVRRAYSAAEVRDLAREAGLRDAWVRVDFPYRLVLTASGDLPAPEKESMSHDARS